MNTFKEMLQVTHKLFFPGYFGTYCGCELDDVKDRCGQDLGHGRPECTQTQAQATGAASCNCNPDWDGDRSAHIMIMML